MNKYAVKFKLFGKSFRTYIPAEDEIEAREKLGEWIASQTQLIYIDEKHSEGEEYILNFTRDELIKVYALAKALQLSSIKSQDMNNTCDQLIEQIVSKGISVNGYEVMTLVENIINQYSKS